MSPALIVRLTMPRWNVEVIHEPTGQYMNFYADTDTDEQEPQNSLI